MSAEIAILPKRKRATRRSLAERIRAALQGIASGRAEFLSHREKSWASVTFAGTRHTVTMRFTGGPAVEMGEYLIVALPDHEFDIPGQLVAEATVAEADTRLSPEFTLTVTVELLLLEDA